jgi:hypothetical protein
MPSAYTLLKSSDTHSTLRGTRLIAIPLSNFALQQTKLPLMHYSLLVVSDVLCSAVEESGVPPVRVQMNCTLVLYCTDCSWL